MRPSGRAPNELRAVTIEVGVNCHAEGSCLIRFGSTHLLCTATVEERVPPFLRNTGKGWVTAEYGMLPRATNSRSQREAARGKQSGRTQEIQRLIGRSLRAVTELDGLGERQVILDCDVLQADGGTRTAAITGAYVALHQALARIVKRGRPAAPAAARAGRGRVLRAGRTGWRSSISTMPRTARPRRTPTSSSPPRAESSRSSSPPRRFPWARAQVRELERLAATGIAQLVALQRAALAETGPA